MKGKIPRKWKAGSSYGMAGTDSTWEIDLVDDGYFEEHELETLPIETIKEQLQQALWEEATEKVEAWAEPC